MTLNVAVLGGGIFATEAHMPALAKQSDINIVGVWSRSKTSATKAAQVWSTLSPNSTSKVYWESESQDSNLESLLNRSDVAAVIIALPIFSQPDIIRRALAAGKHVLSEKPLGKDIMQATELIDLYEKEYAPRGQIWRVAENWEIESAHLFAAEAIRQGRIGDVHSFSISSVLFVHNEGNKYFDTEWRKTPQHQGGYLFDAGVHNAGVLRTVLPQPLTHISATIASHNAHLPPADYLTAIARTDNKIQGQILIDYGARGRRPMWELRVAGSGGEIHSTDVLRDGVDSIEVTVSSGLQGGDESETRLFAKDGVFQEQRSFFEAIRGSDDGYCSPRGGLADVVFLELALKSNGREMSLYRHD